METDTLLKAGIAVVTALGLGGTYVGQSSTNECQESIERWEVQLDKANDRSDKREAKNRDACLDYIKALSPPKVTTALYTPVSYTSSCVYDKCPDWQCTTDDQCLGCSCIEGYCSTEEN